jgi:putative transposase
VVTPDQRRAAAGFLAQEHHASQRRACRLLGCPRSSLRYTPTGRAGQGALAQAVLRAARAFPRWGYRRVHALLTGGSRYGGWSVNVKRVRRLWRQLGLARPVRVRKARKLGPKRGSGANSCDKTPALFENDVWCCDFVADRTRDGRPLKWLTLLDEYTRECLALRVGRSMSGADVREALGRVAAKRGAPRRVRSDNGSEFVCEALAGWLRGKGAEPVPVEPGSPWQNGVCEAFNGRFRDECLEAEEFESVQGAVELGRWYRRTHNTIRPHSALGYKTPRQFSDECDRGLHGMPPDDRRIIKDQ